MSFQELLESSRVIEPGFSRAEDERSWAFSEVRPQFSHAVSVRFELSEVSTSELRPFLRIVLIPAAQLMRRGDFLRPDINGCARFRYAAGPQAIYQNSAAIGPRWFFIDSLGSKVHLLLTVGWTESFCIARQPSPLRRFRSQYSWTVR